MIQKTKITIILFFIILIASCVKTRVIRYETIYREPKPANFPIELYESNNITRPFKVIGLAQANAGKLHSTKDTIKHLQNIARKMGGDALLDLGIRDSTGRMVSRVGYGYVSGSAREIWTAKLIVWLDKDNKKTLKDNY